MTESPTSPEAERPAEPEPTSYVDTPRGLFTEHGIWFHVTEADLKAYAGDVIGAVPIETLIEWASTWLRSPRTLALWLLPALLWMLSPTWAVAATVLAHVMWTLAGPSLVSEVGARVFGWLENVFVQGLYYVLVLSALAAGGAHGATVVALTGFVLLRFRLVDKTVRFVTRPARRALYTLPLPDQVLRAFLIRAALNRRLPIPQLYEMASEMMSRWGGSGGASS